LPWGLCINLSPRLRLRNETEITAEKDQKDDGVGNGDGNGDVDAPKTFQSAEEMDKNFLHFATKSGDGQEKRFAITA